MTGSFLIFTLSAVTKQLFRSMMIAAARTNERETITFTTLPRIHPFAEFWGEPRLRKSDEDLPEPERRATTMRASVFARSSSRKKGRVRSRGGRHPHCIPLARVARIAACREEMMNDERALRSVDRVAYSKAARYIASAFRKRVKARMVLHAEAAALHFALYHATRGTDRFPSYTVTRDSVTP